MAEGRNAEGADEGRPLLVHRELLQPAVVPAEDTLGRHRDLVKELDRIGCVVGDAADVDEHRGRPAELGEPIRLAGVEAGK